MPQDKHWAKSYLIDPLTAPDPSDETGPGSHFRSTFAPASTFTSTPSPSVKSPESTPAVSLREHVTGTSTASTNPFRRSSIKERGGPSGAAYPTPPNSVSPRRENFPASHREEAFAAYSHERQTTNDDAPQRPGNHRRNSSLTARFPGDDSHRPLDIIRRHSKRANRAPHLQKKHMPGADLIDRLDIQAYHHEGPYDAVLAVRNTSFESSPLAAVADTNAEALKATPRENIQDSLRRHRPLDGTAIVPPGVPDQYGRVYDYEEGTDMMRDLGGNYKRWAHVEYLPEDLKGKGEPSYSIEKALKEHKKNGDNGIEMTSRNRGKSVSTADLERQGYTLEGPGVRRNNTTGRRVAEGLKRTFGSLRRSKKT